MAIQINGSSAAGNIDLGTNGTITDLAVGGLPDDSIALADLSATGTASSSTFLRGDNTWAAAGVTGLTAGSGNITIDDGNLIVASGHGIDFSATSDGPTSTSELFDDYETGTWTVTCGNSVTLQSNQDLAVYVKIGRVVHVNGQLQINSGNSGAAFTITNMPFATAASAGEATASQYMLASTFNLNHHADTIGIRLNAGGGTQTMQLIDVKDDGIYSAVAAEDGNYVILGGSYLTD